MAQTNDDGAVLKASPLKLCNGVPVLDEQEQATASGAVKHTAYSIAHDTAMGPRDYIRHQNITRSHQAFRAETVAVEGPSTFESTNFESNPSNNVKSSRHYTTHLHQSGRRNQSTSMTSSAMATASLQRLYHFTFREIDTLDYEVPYPTLVWMLSC
jgi:hypothetical protein